MSREHFDTVILKSSADWKREMQLRRDVEADIPFASDDLYFCTLDELVVQGVIERGKNHAQGRLYRLTELGLSRREALLTALRRGRLFSHA